MPPLDRAARVLERAEEIERNGLASAVDPVDDDEDVLFRPRITFRRASDIEPSRPEWCWDRWLCAGALHLLVGRQSGGKSTFAAWLVGKLTTGAQFPGDSTQRARMRCGVLSLEEPDDRIVARLQATGADVSRVVVLGAVEDLDSDGRPYRRPWRMPNDTAKLEEFIGERKIAFIVVDGLGYAVSGDGNSYANIGAALSGLAGVAERTGCSILGLSHPPKGASDPLTAAIGSTAWTAIPRLVWVLGVDPQDGTKSRRVVRVSKSNFQYPDSGLGFVIGNHEELECGYVTELTQSSVTAEELVAASATVEERTEREEARELVHSLLSDGPMDVSELFKATRAAGFSDTTVKRARGDLGTRSNPRKDPTNGRTLGWSVALPDHQVNPEGQPPFGPLDPLGATRAFVGSRGPVGQATRNAPRPADSLPDERDPAPDDGPFEDSEFPDYESEDQSAGLEEARSWTI